MKLSSMSVEEVHADFIAVLPAASRTCKVRVRQCLLWCGPITGVKRKHAVQQFERSCISAREVLLKGHAWLAAHAGQEAACLLIAHLQPEVAQLSVR